MPVSKRLRYEVLRRDNHACRYCGAAAPDVKLTVDHVTPVALGGVDTAENLVAACADCNAGKTSSTPDAPLVANVADDALRWANAMEKAAEAAREDFQARLTYREAFREAWDKWAVKGTEGRDRIPLDAGWEQSLDNFRAAGLPDWELGEAVNAAMSMKKLKPENVFRYFCGICWGKIRKMQEHAAQIVGSGTQPVQLPSTGDRWQHTLDLWIDGWTARHGFPNEDSLVKASRHLQHLYAQGHSEEKILEAVRGSIERRLSWIAAFLGYGSRIEDAVISFYEGCSIFSHGTSRMRALTPKEVVVLVEIVQNSLETVSRAFHDASKAMREQEDDAPWSAASKAMMDACAPLDQLIPQDDDYMMEWAGSSRLGWPL